jgi:hypothetical protein
MESPPGVLATLFLCFLAFVAALVLSFRMGGEARALRQEVFAAAPGEWEREFEIGVGALPSLLSRAALHFVKLEPEVRAGVSAFRSADIGIYHRRTAGSRASRNDALDRVDTLMARRGWEPLVSVRDGDEAVRVFLPRDLGSLRRTRVGVFVMERSTRRGLRPTGCRTSVALAERARRGAKPRTGCRFRSAWRGPLRHSVGV